MSPVTQQMTPPEVAQMMRELGPHVLDVREAFSDVVVSPREWLDLATHVQTKGRGPGSLEDDETAGLDYHVITRSTIARELNPLYVAYHRLVPLVTQALGRPVVLGSGEDAINVNIVQGEGGRYELHTDSQRWTLLVFATGQAFNGGDLIVQHPGFGTQFFPPVLGQGILFDGSKLPHAVTPMQELEGWGAPLRITVPMVFIDPAVDEVRPEGTDSYLYAGKQGCSRDTDGDGNCGRRGCPECDGGPR